MSNRKRKNSNPVKKDVRVQAENNAQLQNDRQAEDDIQLQEVVQAENDTQLPEDVPGNDAQLQESGQTENDAQLQEDIPAEDGEGGSSDYRIEHTVNGWVEELKEQLDYIAEKARNGAAPDGAADESETSAAPVRSKDDIQRELAEMKAEFTHTPMKMTPELEMLLTDDIKAKGKKEKKRGAQMLSVLANHNFYANGLTPAELRTTLEDLGPTYVKIGQIMSSRVDLLPESYCKELEKLRQNVKELDPAVVRAIIEAETGKKIDEIYSRFSDKPIGSASIGQVHYGVLRDGTKVVTKVQRPLIAEMMEKDFELLKKLAPMIGGVAPAEDGEDAMDLVTIINEFEKVTKEELDFRIEAANTRFFREVVLEDGQVTCPRVIDELTTERIFTMTYVDGCSVSKKDQLPKMGIDPVQAGRDILESYVHQVFDVGIFHADPHQGNIMVSGGKVYWIDFGMIGEITEADMNALTDLVVGLLKGDTEEMANGVMAIGTSSAGTDRNKLKEDLELLSNKYMNVSSLNDIDFSALLGEVCDLADKHHVVLPGRYTMLVRSFLTIEGVMEQLCPELNLFEVISDKLMERMKKSFSLEKEIMSLGQGALDVGKKVSRIPQMIADTLTDIMKGRVKINLELTGYDDLIRELNDKINDLILVIVGCVLFSGGCKLSTAQIYPKSPNGMPLVAVIILMVGISLIIYALKRVFKKK